MQYFSHVKELENNKRIGSKTIKEHINGVNQKAQKAIYPHLNFSVDFHQLKDFICDLSRYHDLGKFTSYFQKYLLTGRTENESLKSHARVGAFAAINLYSNKDEKLSLLIYYLVHKHHRNLENFTKDNFFSKSEAIRIENNFKKQYNDLHKKILDIENELSINKLSDILVFPDSDDIINIYEDVIEDEPNIENYYFINYCFSLLIEADKLDASETLLYTRKEIKTDLVDAYIGVAQYPEFDDMCKLTQNQRRNFARNQVVSQLNNKDVYNQQLFTLTAPTGIGKTLTALDFALKLRAEIAKEKDGYQAQIICALPFINIIEQTLEVYEQVLGDAIKVLAHYQFADIFGENKKENEEDGDDYNKKKMQLDTWQADVVITSFVQFLETLIGNRNKLLKKFNHFTGSIIILDEVQTIRLGDLPLIGSALYYLTKFLDCRVVLMTATKPKIFELANQEILNDEGEEAKAFELLTNFNDVFAVNERTKIIPLIDKTLNETKDFVSDFKEKWDVRKSCLIVVNKVQRSIDLFDAIKKFVEENNFDNPVHCLSTNRTPIERFHTICDIKNEMSCKKQKPILIATQVVEAGVDLDFDMGFRDLGPIDSIIQVAGRINRNNKKAKESPLYVVDFGDCGKIYDSITDSRAKSALNQYPNGVSEKAYLSLIENYFQEMSDSSSFEKSRKIFQSMKNLQYSEHPDKLAVKNYKVINDSRNTLSVYIEIDYRAVEVKEAFKKFIKGDLPKANFEKNYKRDFHQRIIAVPNYLLDELKGDGSIIELTENIYILTKDELQSCYSFETGFIRKPKDREKESTIML